MEETIQTLTDGKQDKIFNLKQGFFSPRNKESKGFVKWIENN